MRKEIEDEDLGRITIMSGSKYKRYTLKVSDGAVIATMPERGDEQRMLSFIAEKKNHLLGLLQKYPAEPILDETTDIQMATFRLCILRTDQQKSKVTLRDGLLTIHCQSHISFEDEKVQSSLKEIVRNVCRHEAKRVLPVRLKKLAEQYGFSYTGVRITSSRTRWGSCTGGKSINLSLYLMQLPWHLIDYVLLHELCHTREMNHSDRFWALMDKVTDSRAKILRKELKEYRML